MTMQNSVILVTNDGMGRADTPLQHMLIGKYFELLLANGDLPAAICFYTEGVKLVVEGSPVLTQLAALEHKGVHLVLCSTCLNYFKLTDSVRVGIVGGMGDILAAQAGAEKVITL